MVIWVFLCVCVCVQDNGTDCKARRAEQEALKRNLGSKDRVKGSYLNLNV
jgi:hypothetical protein